MLQLRFSFVFPSRHIAESHPQFPLVTSPLRGVPATPAEQLCLTLIPSRSAALQDFYFCWMPEHDAAVQLNLATSRQEVKHRNNKQHPVTFQNKTLRVDTSTQISKQRQTQALLLILRSGTLPVVVCCVDL